MLNRILAATLIGAVVSFLLGWAVFGMLLMPYYEANTVNYPGLFRSGEEMRLYAIFLAQVTGAGLLAVVFERWGNIRSFGTGLAGGVLIGGLMYATFDLYMWASMNLYPVKLIAFDIIANAAFAGIIGGVIGVVLGWKRTN